MKSLNGKTHRIGHLAMILALLIPVAAWAEKPADKGPGGKALEQRSEQAAERANSQSEDTAAKGGERADEVREAAAGATDRVREQKDETTRAAKDAEKELRKEAKVDEGAKEPEGRARGFRARLFGGDDSGEE